MKLNCLIATALAQFDYNPNAEYESDYKPDQTIARGVKFQRPTGDVNQFAISSALSEQLNAMGGADADNGNIDFGALAALLLERGNGPRPRSTTTTTTAATTTPKPAKTKVKLELLLNKRIKPKFR